MLEQRRYRSNSHEFFVLLHLGVNGPRSPHERGESCVISVLLGSICRPCGIGQCRVSCVRAPGPPCRTAAWIAILAINLSEIEMFAS